MTAGSGSRTILAAPLLCLAALLACATAGDTSGPGLRSPLMPLPSRAG